MLMLYHVKDLFRPAEIQENLQVTSQRMHPTSMGPLPINVPFPETAILCDFSLSSDIHISILLSILRVLLLYAQILYDFERSS